MEASTYRCGGACGSGFPGFRTSLAFLLVGASMRSTRQLSESMPGGGGPASDDRFLDFSELKMKANDCGLPATGYGSVPDLGELESAPVLFCQVVAVVTLNPR